MLATRQIKTKAFNFRELLILWRCLNESINSELMIEISFCNRFHENANTIVGRKSFTKRVSINCHFTVAFSNTKINSSMYAN